MATGLYVLPDRSVMVAYGHRQIPISCAQYKANGYKPALEKLTVTNSFTAEKSRIRPPGESPPTGPKGAPTERDLRPPDLAGTSSTSCERYAGLATRR
jgi:hypothetical protein